MDKKENPSAPVNLSLEETKTRAVKLMQQGNIDAALLDLYAILRQEQNNTEVRNQIRFIHKKKIGSWHFDMMNDSVRNNSYQAAIRDVVKPGMIVFEIGTGSGLLSMIAAQAGAKHVYTCEKELPIRIAAQQIISRNGLSDKITILDKWSTSVSIPQDIPEKADLVIGEIFGPGLLEEQAIYFFNDAKNRLTKPEGTILPKQATMFGALLESADISARGIVGSVEGFDLRLFNGLLDDCALQFNLSNYPHKLLSESQILDSVKFSTEIEQYKEIPVTFTATQSGVCHGIAQWFSLNLTHDIAFSTSPKEPRTHWDQQIQIFEKPFPVTAGQEIPFIIRRFSDRYSLKPIMQVK